MNTRPTLLAAFPSFAARIDTERPLIARDIADHVTVSWDDDTIILHCDDAPSYQLLTTLSQLDYLTTTAAAFGFTLQIAAPPTAAAAPDPAPEPQAEPKPLKSYLSYQDRKKLEAWMQEPENTHYVQHESDTDAARKASQDLDPLHLTASNIAGMRKMLGIAKARPTPPPELPLPPDLDLAKLQAQVNEQGSQLDALRVQATGMKDTLTELRRAVRDLIMAHNAKTGLADVIWPLPELVG